MQQSHHEVEIQTMLSPSLQLLQRALIARLDALENIPGTLARADTSRQIVQFRQSEGLRHAKGLRAVVEEGQEIDGFAGEGLFEAGLMDALEGAGLDLALGVLVEGLLGDGAAEG